MKHFKVTLLIISILVFFYHLFQLFYLWPNIPERIAIHFTNDTPDNWGSKYFLFIMPVLSIFIWFLTGLVVNRPEKMNYVNLTEANKDIQYSRTKTLLILIQNFSFLSLILVNEAFLKYSVGMDFSLPLIIALALLAICLIAPIYLLIWSATLKY